MQLEELIVARLSGGLGFGRCLGPASSVNLVRAHGDRIRISVGRNREAQIPVARVVMATGDIVSGEEEVEKLRKRCNQLAAGIDLSLVWEIICGDPHVASLKELTELYWGSSGDDVVHTIALLLHLDRTSLYFVNHEDGFAPQTQESVQKIRAHRKLEEENAQAAASVIEHLAIGRMPPKTNPYQLGLLEHLRGYAVHGDNYTKSATARGLVEKIAGVTRDPQRRSFELLVNASVLLPDEPLELARAGIPIEFSNDALAEAESIDPSMAINGSHRRDLTAMSSITVDDVGTEDRDDAVSLETEGPRGGFGVGTRQKIYRVGIHIADAGALVPVEGSLDKEADQRMATLYMPEYQVPMLPVELSHRKGSLVPGERRPALSLLARITESGQLLSWEIVPSIVRSQAALSYDEADRALEDRNHLWHQMLSPMHQVAQSLQSRRRAAGATIFDRPEMIVKVSASGQADVRVLPQSTPARLTVSEFMIFCNSMLAEFCHLNHLPAAYRSQSVPDFSDVSAQIPEGPLRRYLLMRRLPSAGLGITPATHSGLGIPAYIQATSPLRRYPDLVMQRQISRFLDSGQPLYTAKTIASVAQRAEVQLKELAKIEEDRKRYWFLKYLEKDLRQGEGGEAERHYQAITLENQAGRSALLELVAYPFRFRAELPKSCIPGNTVRLWLRGVDLWQRRAQFVHEPFSR